MTNSSKAGFDMFLQKMRNSTACVAPFNATRESPFHEYLMFVRRMVCHGLEEPKFLIVDTTTGLGNRMQVSVSALALAMASKRALLLRWTISFDLNCPVEELWLPPAGYPPFVVNWSDLAGIVDNSEVSYEFRLSHRIGFAYEWLHCSELAQQGLGDWPVVILYHAPGHRHFAPLVLHNPHHADYFEARFPDYSFVRHGLQWLFGRPVSKVVQRMVQLLGNHSRPAVGLHLRAQYQSEDFDAAVDLFARASRPHMQSHLLAPVFVAADSNELISKIKAKLPGRIVLHSEKSLVRQHAQTCPELQDALAELLVLSQSDVVVGTRESTFSTCAAALNPGKYVSVCFSQKRCSKIGWTERSRAHGICYWEWTHARNFACLTQDRWRMLQSECCGDSLCDECWYHPPGVRAWLGQLPYWRPRDVLLASCGWVLCCLTCCSRALRRIVWAGMLLMGWGFVVAFSTEYWQQF